MGTDVYEKSNLALKVRNFRMVFKQLFRDLRAYPLLYHIKDVM